MRKNTLILLCLLPIMVAAGPCDVMDALNGAEDAGDPDAAAECVPAVCEDRLYVEAVRSDNAPFEDGTYGFSGAYPTGAYVASQCLYDSQAGGMDCQNSGMIAEMAADGRKISLTYQGAPETFTVGVSVDYVPLGEIALAPAYESPDPEAPCPSACLTATEIVAIENL